MKKNPSQAIPKKTAVKGAFYQAGEIIGSIGFHIVDGKDKVIGAVSEEYNNLKKAVKKKLGKKQKPASKTKKVSTKKSAGKGGKKITKSVRKTATKTRPEKVVGKKTANVKKSSKSAG